MDYSSGQKGLILVLNGTTGAGINRVIKNRIIPYSLL